MKHERNVEKCNCFKYYSPHKSTLYCGQQCSRILIMANTNRKY